MTGTVVRLHGFQGPTAAELTAGLPEIGEGLLAQLETLSRDPQPWACETMARNLEGARLAVLRLREALLRESPPPGEAA